jgi:hypothetical protein
VRVSYSGGRGRPQKSCTTAKHCVVSITGIVVAGARQLECVGVGKQWTIAGQRSDCGRQNRHRDLHDGSGRGADQRHIRMRFVCHQVGRYA